MLIYIYGLVDPRDNRVRYVGKTNNLKTRLRQHMKHLHPSQGIKKVEWLTELKHEGLKPEITILEECDENTWKEAEVHWISVLRGVYDDLTNSKDGGESGRTPENEYPEEEWDEDYNPEMTFEDELDDNKIDKCDKRIFEMYDNGELDRSTVINDRVLWNFYQ